VVSSSPFRRCIDGPIGFCRAVARNGTNGLTSRGARAPTFTLRSGAADGGSDAGRPRLSISQAFHFSRPCRASEVFRIIERLKPDARVA
jgi:hypothetical protein